MPWREKYSKAWSVPKEDSPSTMNSRMGPKTLTQNLSMTASSVGAFLSTTSSPTCQRIQRQTMWQTINRSRKIKSHSTWSLKLRAKLMDATGAGDGRRHILQMRQVSTMSAISFNMSDGHPAAFSTRSMDEALACHHLRWSLRRILR